MTVLIISIYYYINTKMPLPTPPKDVTPECNAHLARP